MSCELSKLGYKKTTKKTECVTYRIITAQCLNISLENHMNHIHMQLVVKSFRI